MTKLTCVSLTAGSCSAIERVVFQQGRWRTVYFPATVLLLHHPVHGYGLVDTGYSQHFFAASARLPYRAYRWATPVQFDAQQAVAAQLPALGVPVADIKWIILTHLHADHAGGLLTFPTAQVFVTQTAWQAAEHVSGVTAVRQAILPALFPKDFGAQATLLTPQTTVALPQQWQPFQHGHDVFGDGSVFTIGLPGHAPGQVGVAFLDQANRAVFAVADACWTQQELMAHWQPTRASAQVLHHSEDYRATQQLLRQLHAAQPDIVLLPTHCAASHAAYRDDYD